MSSLVDYINSWWYTPDGSSEGSPGTNEENTEATSTPVYLVSRDELLAVKLKPIKDVIPAPARNMPHMNKFQLHMLNQAQLRAILNVKLKHIERKVQPKVYQPRHPVLKELLQRRSLVC